MDKPYILEETPDFAVAFKPPKMHSTPLKQKEGDSLQEWYLDGSAELIHRLDFETHGLVLFAKNAKSFEFFRELQDKGGFVKEYSAVCGSAKDGLAPGFPPPPVLADTEPSPEKPLVISSYFRPFGPGRKEVRPVFEDGKKQREIAKDKGGFYRTEITSKRENVFIVRIKRGFRHQIRCHLCWIGCPIEGDLLYNPQAAEPEQRLALRAHGLLFTDPSSGAKREYFIDPVKQ
jgi:23S rRNA pseudouridine1911/1915/1917 synthase